MSKECDKPRNPATVTCRNCDEMGHFSRDCTKKKDYSKVKCSNCDQSMSASLFLPASSCTLLTKRQWVMARRVAKSQSKKLMMEVLVLAARQAVRQAASMHLLVERIMQPRLLEEEMRGLLVPLMTGVPRLQQR